MIGEDIKSVKGEMDDSVKEWFAVLERGIKRRRKEEKRWEHNEKFEDMKQWSGELGSGDEITVNKVGSYIRNYRAQVAYNNPHCKCTPRTSDGWKPVQVPVAGPGGMPEMAPDGSVVTREVIPAKAREALVESIVNSPMQNTQQTSGLVVKAGVIAYGALECGYGPIFETPIDPASDQVIGDGGKMDLSRYARNPVTGELVEDDNGRLVDRNSIPVWEDFYIKWVPYRNLIIDPDGGNYWDDHAWVAREEIRTLKSVKADDLFENTSDLKAMGRRMDDDGAEFNFDEHGSDWSAADDGEYERANEKVVRLLHIFDMETEEYIVLADGHGKELRRVSWSELGIVDHPYSDFRPNQILGEFYPRPLATDLAPINEWYNQARRLELTAMKRSVRKNIIRKGVTDVNGMDALTNDEDMAWAEFDIADHKPLGDQILQLLPPALGSDVYRNSQMIANDFAEVGGMTDEARGKASADSATQASIMEQYSGTRIAHDRKIMAECWLRLFKKLNDLIDRHMTKERAIRVQGTDGQVFNALVDPDLIAGDYDYEVDFEDLAENNTAAQSAGRAQIAQIAGQAPHLFTSEPLVRGWLEPFGIKDQNFIDALVKASQMQMQMLMAQAMPPQQGPVPEAGAPRNEADAIAQTGAGMQTRRMSSAT